MRKIIAAICAFFTLTTLAFAENSGIIIGGQFNYGWFTRNTQGSYTSTSGSGFWQITKTYVGTGAQSAGYFGGSLLLGYKHFFTNRFGVRIYAEAGGNAFRVEESPDELLTFSRYSGNLDLLYNFVDTTDGSHGLFAGVNFQRISWPHDDVASYHFTANTNEYSTSGVGASIGYRTKEGGHSGEFGVQVPFLKETMIHRGPNGQSLSMKDNFSLFLRYVYNIEF